jgi:hypothetical protein
MQVLICPECGTENSLDAESCQNCAASLVDVSPVDRPEQEKPTEDDIRLVDEPENDLPELLHALKQAEDSDISEDAIQNDRDGSSPDSEAIFGAEEVIEDEDVPEWLQRIRERTQQEEDSVGEITQKISAAKESVEESHSKDQRDNFESWIQQLRDQATQIPDHPQGGEAHAALPDEIPAWLLKIRKERIPPDEHEAVSEASEEDTAGKDLPGWLVPEEQYEVDQPTEERRAEEDTLQIEVTSRTLEEDETQEVDTSEFDVIVTKKPVISVGREEQANIDQLMAIIADEQATRTITQTVKRSSMRVSRLILGILLIAGLILSLFIGGIPGLSQGQVQPYNLALLTWADNLTDTSSLLVVLDYQPGFSSEVSIVAKPIIENSLTTVSEISILSSTPLGSLLFTHLVRELGLEEDILINDLGYFPIPSYGAYYLAIHSGANWRFRNLPQIEKALPPDGYDGILILSDTFEGSSAWIEQLSSLMPNIPINLLVTSQAGPLLKPYIASGQVMGMISGISEAVGIENVLDQSARVKQGWHTYQIGVLMLIALMVIGTIFPGGKKGHIERQKKA